MSLKGVPRAPIKELPERSELLRLFAYDPDTGVLRWRVQPSKHAQHAKAGLVAGTISAKGYLVVGLARSYYLAHRIIWKMVTGEEPTFQIDHRNGDRLNNRWDNFRPATNGLNVANSKIRVDNKSGVKGVCWESDRGKWLATVTKDKIIHKIGRFDDIRDAAAAVAAARIRLHGEFARHS